MKIATVGTNFIVDTFIEAVRKNAGAEIAAVYSREKSTGEAFAAKHGINKVITDREALLNDPGLDFIYVAAPNSLHYPWALDALKAGRNVICEKPFVSNEAELRELIAAAKQKNLFLFEALTVPHLPNFKLLREKLPLVGNIRMVQLNFSQYSSRWDAFLAGKNPNLFNPEFSGGALMDLNYYNLCFTLRLFGPPADIRYFANLASNGIDTSGVLLLQYDGFIVTAVATKDSDSKNFVQIQGEKGYIVSESTSSNLRSGFSFVTKKSQETFNEQDSENVLFYEVGDFIKMYKADDTAAAYKELEHSLAAAKYMDMARKDAGIVFAADKK